jgi:hypothetical protein
MPGLVSDRRNASRSNTGLNMVNIIFAKLTKDPFWPRLGESKGDDHLPLCGWAHPRNNSKSPPGETHAPHGPWSSQSWSRTVVAEMVEVPIGRGKAEDVFGYRHWQYFSGIWANVGGWYLYASVSINMTHTSRRFKCTGLTIPREGMRSCGSQGTFYWTVLIFFCSEHMLPLT